MDHKTQLGIFVAIIIVVIILACAATEGKCFSPNPSPPTPVDRDQSLRDQSTGMYEKKEAAPGCYSGSYCQPSMEAFYPSTRQRRNPYEMPQHNPGHDIYGYNLNNNYCRYGLGQEGIVDGENDLWRFQIYTVQPSMVNLKFQKVHM